MVDGAFDYIRRIDDHGGMVEAVEAGFPQREIMDAAYQFQKAVEANEKLVVGVNSFEVTDDEPIEVLSISDELGPRQVAFTQQVKDGRDAGAARRTLEALKTGAAGDENTMPLILDCVKAYCTVGEISDAMRDVFGTYEEPAVF
jgi:methylmalonyl-CoA mutase N-terminal domain/subunit